MTDDAFANADTPPSPEGSTRGRLLVAAPGLMDPHFVRTVLLMVEHSEEGALGIVLNRPSETRVADVLERWGNAVSAPGVFHAGGPVATEGFIALASSSTRGSRSEPPTTSVVDSVGFDGWVEIFDGLVSVDLSGSPEDLPHLDAMRIFSGHAGWGPGQLEQELAAGGWIVVDRSSEDLFTPRPSELWRDVLDRQAGRLSWFAAAPVDPSTN